MWIDRCNATINLNLEQMEKFANEFNQNFKAIHIGGTNGKGSVSAFIVSSLYKYKVGLYTSPHLERVNERIKINGKEIRDDEIKKYEWLCKYNFTYFEGLTALAFKYFEENNVDYAVIEVGMGGKYDATNIINPFITIITNVEIEHTQWLGDSIEKIAKEKAGIIKNAPVVTGCKGKALEIVKKMAKEKGVEIYVEGVDFSWKRSGKHFLIKSDYEYLIKPKMNAIYQGSNIAIAVKSLEIIGMEKNDIIKGIENAFMPARMERIGKYIIDGAHNPAAIRAFIEALKEVGIKPIVIFGAMKDKDVKSMLSIVSPAAKKFILTKASCSRAMEPEKMAKWCKGCVLTKNVEEAIEMVEKMNEDVAIVGSLYLAGEARKILKSKAY